MKIHVKSQKNESQVNITIVCQSSKRDPHSCVRLKSALGVIHGQLKWHNSMQTYTTFYQSVIVIVAQHCAIF